MVVIIIVIIVVIGKIASSGTSFVSIFFIFLCLKRLHIWSFELNPILDPPCRTRRSVQDLNLQRKPRTPRKTQSPEFASHISPKVHGFAESLPAAGWSFSWYVFITFIIITRPKPAYGRQGLAGSWGQDTNQARILWGILNVSLRASGTQLGYKLTLSHKKPTWNHEKTWKIDLEPWKTIKTDLEQ